jgi:hypothetical protein
LTLEYDSDTTISIPPLKSIVLLAEPRLAEPRLDEPRLDEPRLDEPRRDEPRRDEPRLDNENSVVYISPNILGLNELPTQPDLC